MFYISLILKKTKVIRATIIQLLSYYVMQMQKMQKIRSNVKEISEKSHHISRKFRKNSTFLLNTSHINLILAHCSGVLIYLVSPSWQKSQTLPLWNIAKVSKLWILNTQKLSMSMVWDIFPITLKVCTLLY